jgi:hypothetical protein
MEKLPLTNAGVEDLMAQLYALPQVELEVEANAAGADFALWIKEHFELTTSQITYLDNIDEMWLNDAATETKYFLENRLPISLNKVLPPSRKGDEDDDDRGKLLRLDKNETSSYSEENGYSESETLTYSITYPTPE